MLVCWHLIISRCSRGVCWHLIISTCPRSPFRCNLVSCARRLSPQQAQPMCRVGHCYWYQEGPAATFLLAVHHRFEIFFSTCKGVRDEQPEAWRRLRAPKSSAKMWLQMMPAAMPGGLMQAGFGSGRGSPRLAVRQRAKRPRRRRTPLGRGEAVLARHRDVEANTGIAHPVHALNPQEGGESASA